MFFNSIDGFDFRESAGVRKLESGAGLRRALLVGTILGAGAVSQPSIGRAETVTITAPLTNSAAAIVSIGDGASDDLTITTSADVTSTANAGIVAVRGSGAISITSNAVLRGLTNGAYADSASGAVTVTGSGDIISTGFYQTNIAGEGIYAKSGSGSVTISGTGATRAAGFGIRALITSGAGDISISRSGAIESGTDGTQGQAAIYAHNAGSGKVTIQGIGAVTATGVGIDAESTTGAITIAIDTTVTGAAAIKAIATGAGAVTITSGLNARIQATDGSGVLAESNGGDIDIGGMPGLGGVVSSSNVEAISAVTSGAGTIAVKTASGAVVTGALGIYTVAVDGNTTIAIASGSKITGTGAAIYTSTNNGAVVVNNAGAVNGSLQAVRTGTGTSTFNNSGALTLLGQQSNTGFKINNLSGGVLAGTGSFGAVSAASGSVIRVGDRTLERPAMGVMTMSSLTMASGAKLEVRADASGTNDKLNVTGAATLADGATLRVLATPQTEAAWRGGKSFTVLSAGTLTGNFTVIETDYAFLKVSAAKTGNNVLATLGPNWTSFGAYSTTPNQKSVSDVFDRFQTSGSNPLIAKVTTLTISQAPVAMTQLSGTGLAAARTQSFAASGLFNGAVNSEMGKFTGSAGGGSSVLSYAEDQKKITKAFDKVAAKPAEPILDGRVWMQVLGGVANLKPDAANPSERSTNFGLAAGADTAVNPNIRAGFALSGGQSASKVASLATKAEAVWGQAALYGIATDGARYAKAALVYGYLDTDTERTVTAFSTSETAKGTYGANLFSARLEAGQKFVTGGAVNLTPFFAFEPSWLVQNGYSETNAPTIALGYGRTTTRAMPTTLGLKFDADVALDSMRVTPSATFGWVHNFADTASLSPFFVALPGSTFTVAGVKGDRNLARTEFNLEAAQLGSAVTFYTNVRADLGARTSAVRGAAGVTMRF